MKILVYVVVYTEVYLQIWRQKIYLLRLFRRKVYKCPYKVEWSKKYPVTKSNGNPYVFYCVSCKKSVACAHQDLSDLTAHCSRKIDKSFERAIKTTRNLRSLEGFETEANTNLTGQTVRAEVMHTNFMVQHNISFLTAEHLSPLYSQMFSDSKIAKNVKCSRTKTASILNYAMMPALKSSLLDIMKKQPYPLVNDGTSDTGLKKMNAVCC